MGILLKDQQSCTIYVGTTTQYFNLVRGARDPVCDPVLPYLFILVLEMLFILNEKNLEIKGIEIFEL